MTLSNSQEVSNGMLNKTSKIYIVQKISSKLKVATEQYLAFIMISTFNENDYLMFVKLSVIPINNKTIFTDLSKKLTLNSEKIIYSEENQRLKWLNIITVNIKK